MPEDVLSIKRGQAAGAMISRPQIFRNRNVFLIHKRFKRRGKVIHRRLRRKHWASSPPDE